MSTTDSTSALSNNSSTGNNNDEISLKVRTIDQKTYQINILHDASVPQLKESIADATGVVIGRQRLIFRGRVLKNDQRISAYSLEDGHVLHLVVRADNSTGEGGNRDDAAAQSANSSDSSSIAPNSGRFTSVEQRTNDDPDLSMGNLQSNRVVITVPEGSDVNMPFLSSMIANIMNSVQGTMGGGTVIMGTENVGIPVSRGMRRNVNASPSTTTPRARRARGGRTNASTNSRGTTRTTTTTRTMDGAHGGGVSTATSNLRQRLEAEMETITNLLEHENYDFPELSQHIISSNGDADAAFIQSQIERTQQLLHRFNDRMELLPVALDEIHNRTGNHEQQQPLVYPTLRAIETMQSLGESMTLLARLSRHHFLRWTTTLPTTNFPPTSIIVGENGLTRATFSSSVAIPIITNITATTTNAPPVNVFGASSTAPTGATPGRRVRAARNSRAPTASTAGAAAGAGSIRDAFMQQILGGRFGTPNGGAANSTDASSTQATAATSSTGSTTEVTGGISGFFPSFVAPFTSVVFPISMPNAMGGSTTTTTSTNNATRRRGASGTSTTQRGSSIGNWNLPYFVDRLVHSLPSTTFYGLMSGDPNSLQQLMASLGVALSTGIDLPVLSHTNIRPWCESFWNTLREDFIRAGPANNDTWESLFMSNLGQGFDDLMGPVRSFIPDLADQILRSISVGDTTAFGERAANLLRRLVGQFLSGLRDSLQDPAEATDLLVSYLAFRGINERMARFTVENVVTWSDSISSLSSANPSNSSSSSAASRRRPRNEEESESGTASASATVAAKRRRRR